MFPARAISPPQSPGRDRLAELSRPALWILAARIKTLGLSVVPVVAGAGYAALHGGTWRPGITLAAMLSAMAIQIGTNLWNDAADAARGIDGPERLGPPRVTALGLLSAAHVRLAAAIAFGVAAILGLELAFAGGWPIIALGACSLAMGYLYSMGPYPLSGTPLGEALVVLFFGIAAVAGTVWLNGVPIDAQAIALGAVIGLPAAAVLLVNNHRDRVTDARAGRRTLAILIGQQASRGLYAALLMLSLAGAIVIAGPGSAGWLAFALPAVLGARLIRDMARAPVSPALNRLIAGTSLYQMLLLGAIALALEFGR